jgi:hypothetical protein
MGMPACFGAGRKAPFSHDDTIVVDLRGGDCLRTRGHVGTQESCQQMIFEIDLRITYLWRILHLSLLL